MMIKKSQKLISLALMVGLANVLHGAILAPDDDSIKGGLCIWLTDPDIHYDPASGVWTDIGGGNHNAEAMGNIDAWNVTYAAPTLSSGGNPDVFGSEFSTVKFSGDVDDLMRAANINGGNGFSELTIFAVYKLSNQSQSGAGMTRPVGIGSFIGEGANLGDYFNLGNDLSIRKDNGSIQASTTDHPDDTFLIRIARMNPASVDQWINATGTLEQIQNAAGVSYTTSVDNFYLGDLRADSTDGEGTSGYSRSDIEIAQVIAYNIALNNEQIESVSVWIQDIKSAFGPTPEDGAIYEETWANLSWKAGAYAVSHDVYFGTNFDDVNEGAEGTFVGNTMSTFQVVGFPGFPAPEGLRPGTTYYWRIDEISPSHPDSPWKGKVWSFTVPPKKAYNPSPADGAEFVNTNVTLNWTTGLNAMLHTVYFGENFNDVNDAAGGQPLTDPIYTPGELELDKTYYWRVDEFDGVATHKGDVWSFSTIPTIAITDPNFVVWWTLDERQGTTAVDWSGHGHHGTVVGDAQWVEGYQGTALSFKDNVYVESEFQGVTGTHSRTCCAWIKTTTAGTNIMSWGLNSTGQKWRIRTDSTGGLRAEINGGYHYGITDVADGLWHHVTVVFESDTTPNVTDTLLYVDGRLDATDASQDQSMDTASTGVVRIGESPWHNAPFIGTIDDARIYDKALTEQEVQLAMRGNPLLAWAPNPANGSNPDIDAALPLSWSRGDNASQHDVYFGTDKEPLDNADTSDTTGIYRGRQSATTYTPPEGLEWGGGPYYWRIDEYNTDGTISKGNVWMFTVADFILVDDFESYTDNDTEGEAIWQYWIDGFGAAGNGAQVGYLLPPYAEQTIVHSGSQSMPFTYDNTDGVTNSEAVLALTAPRSWTNHGLANLSLWFRGYPASMGSFVEAPAGTYTMTGSGSDIAGTADQFYFAFKALNGPGSIVARISSVQNTHAWAKAGVMIRETLETGSKNAFACVTPGNGVVTQGRTAADGSSFSTNETGIAAPHWVKLERDTSGNFTVSHSANGTMWQSVASAIPTNIPMTSNVYIGLALTSHSVGQACQAAFSNVTITGNVSGQWTHRDIGITTNAAEPMYVELTNANGASAVVSHEDLASATIDQWTEWIIPLQAFADQGINLTDVDSIAIGLGTKAGIASSGGSGTMYFDDIRLYPRLP
jgi:hypothetical protein